MTLTDEQLAEIKADLFQASGVIDNPDAQNNPAALTAMRRAESLLAEVQRLRGELAEANAKVDRWREELGAKRDDLLEVRGILSPSGFARKVPMELVPNIAPAVQWLVDEHERLRAVGEAAKAWALEAKRLLELDPHEQENQHELTRTLIAAADELDSTTDTDGQHPFVELPASSIGSCQRCSRPQGHRIHRVPPILVERIEEIVGHLNSFVVHEYEGGTDLRDGRAVGVRTIVGTDYHRDAAELWAGGQPEVWRVGDAGIQLIDATVLVWSPDVNRWQIAISDCQAELTTPPSVVDGKLGTGGQAPA